MRAETHDRLPVPRDVKKFPVLKLLLAVVVLVGLLLLWFFSGQESEPEVTAPIVPAVIPEPVVPAAPDIPEQAEEPSAELFVAPDELLEETLEPVVVLPTAQEGDDMLRTQMSLSGADSRFDKLAVHEHPVDVTAALIDGMSRGVILRKILPAEAPREAFSVEGEGDIVYMSSASYQRYDVYTESLTVLDTSTLVAAFHTMRPLYERAYEQLGLDPNDFDNAVIRTLDVILATPEFEEQLALKQEKVMYTFADPKLESLSMLQKQLLRMGPENTRRIKAKAQALRDALLKP